ncbi:MAG TPA: hypothetical protein VFW73_09045 [Lacipirellulaceae bacterium]|nr:hypothetical protein [Lacipirellulaceae bacterium]
MATGLRAFGFMSNSVATNKISLLYPLDERLRRNYNAAAAIFNEKWRV